MIIDSAKCDNIKGNKIDCKESRTPLGRVIDLLKEKDCLKRKSSQ